MRPELARVSPIVFLALGLAAPVGAQLRVGFDLSFPTLYEWRGVQRHDGAVLQPSTYVSAGESAWITAGWFGSMELASPKPPAGIGYGRFVGEHDLWVEASRPVGPFDLAVGWTGYFYDLGTARGPPSRLRDTHELYARATLIDLPIVVPEIRAFHDVDQVKGAYLEGRLGVRIPLGPHLALAPIGSLIVTPYLGVSAGQARNPSDPGELWYFEDDGITHYGTSLRVNAAPFAVGPVDLTGSLSLSVEWKEDEQTQIAGSDGSRRARETWVELSVSLSGPRCRPERALCRSQP